MDDAERIQRLEQDIRTAVWSASSALGPRYTMLGTASHATGAMIQELSIYKDLFKEIRALHPRAEYDGPPVCGRHGHFCREFKLMHDVLG